MTLQRTTARSPKKKTAAEETAAARRSARDARLWYVRDDSPGMRRIQSGRGFRYVDARGRPVRKRSTLDRIRALAVPPAWTRVWICPDARGHIQATGRDARGRKQYRYHPRWSRVRSERKFDRMLALGAALPAIRRKVRRDLARRGLAKTKVVALVVRIMDETGMRVGNEEYARANRSFGVTTLRDHHVHFSRGRVAFEFRGKSGKLYTCELADPRVARAIARCQAIPGAELFQYVGPDGRRGTVDSTDVNEYLQACAGEEFSAKDLRTWTGTVLAATTLCRMRRPRDEARRKAVVIEAIDAVAEQLNNTRAVCRAHYVHPAVLDAFESDSLRRTFERTRRASRGLRAPERALIALLRAASST
jgi:DNA topoisomerase-1